MSWAFLKEFFLVDFYLCLMLLELFRCQNTVFEMADELLCCTNHSVNDSTRKCNLKTELEAVGIAAETVPTRVALQNTRTTLNISSLTVDNSEHFFIH